VARVSATVSQGTAGRACDGLVSTGWRAGPAASAPGRRIVLDVAGPGLSRVTLWGAGPGAPRTVSKVRVTARCASTRLEVAAEVELPVEVRPVRVRVPGLASCASATVSVEVRTVADGAAEAVLNEVVPEVLASEGAPAPRKRPAGSRMP
jgi:hypothetical protein